MKKFLYSAMILSLAFATSCDNNNADKPKTWDTALGKAGFATDSIWTISGNGITQEWSDAVQASDCSDKNTFSGYNSETSSYNVDCRSNPGQKGDLFSWRAVTEVENLCPEGWRVPDSADFRNLDIALGFSGENRYSSEVNGHSSQAQLDRYFSDWGDAYGGGCGSLGSLYGQGLFGVYWSLSEDSADVGFGLYFCTNGVIYPQNWYYKGIGITLRCIR
ncbi:MAG: fibrobacter succinogenes major paralogous domain-containing protein [Bacteroidales bacterium]|nr:fibrobacter succinogenes major paralogous domain-containing protein [Bacteroidales bacterium]